MTDAPQTAADLRTLVLRRVGEKKKVVLLAPDAGLAAALEGAGCEVLRDPESLDEVRAFAPHAVVAFDGLIERGRGDEVFLALATAAPSALVLFSFANCASASSLLAGLEGRPPPPGLSEKVVRAWLAAAGLEVATREVVVMPHAPTGLSPDTEAALRQLLEQLNPEAGVDRVLLGARRGKALVPEVKTERVESLISVLVVGDGDALALDSTLASVTAQTVRPLQVVCAVAKPEQGVSKILDRAAEKDGLAAQVVVTGDVEPARMAQRAQALATGQYLALFRAGDVADKEHLARLHRALTRGTSAWAHALVTRGNVAPPPLPSALARLAGAESAACGWLLDLNRLGTFPVAFAEGVPAWESLLYARLSALFPPALLGTSGVERTKIVPEPMDGWAEALKARPLRMLTALDQQLELARPQPVPPAADVLARALGKTLETNAPQLYGRLKKAAKRII